MEKINVISMRRFFALLLGVLLLLCALPLPAYAAAADPGTDGESEAGLVNADELKKLVVDYLGQHDLSTLDISVGYYYSATGETWYYNGDKWFYPASMYKVPLMMLLSEKVKAGEISQDTLISEMTVADIEENILTYSNNDWAHTIRTYMGGDELWREQCKRYSTLPNGDYDPDYMSYCYYSNRYMTDVMKTLYASPEDYPNVIDCLLEAEPEHYFRLELEGQYKIAQKYGSFVDDNNNTFMNATGVIYMPNPIIVTVMTRNVYAPEQVISDLAVIMRDYTLKLDKQLSRYEAEREKAEQDRLAAEEAQRKAEADAAAEAERVAAEAEAAQKAIAEQQVLQQARRELFTKLLILAGAIAVVAIAASLAFRSRGRKKREERYEAYRRRYEAEQRSMQAEQPARRNDYRPRH